MAQWGLLGVAMVAIGLVTTGCSFFRTPYALTLNEQNENDAQQKAVIELSDPQVYARETLVNDRRDEVEYLRKTLKASETVRFGSEIRRQLTTIRALSAALGIDFNPAKGITFERSKEIGDLEHEIRLTRLRSELAVVQDQLKKSRTGESVPSVPSIGNTSTTTALEPPNTATAPTINSTLGDLEALTTKLLNTINQEVTALRETSTSASPQDEFRDRQAYRSELRAALAGINLDDLHDYGDKSLFRLQFRATVLPGQHKDKFGVARLTMLPTQLSDDDLVELYLAWLAHSTNRLNQTSFRSHAVAAKQEGKASRAIITPDERYELLAAGARLFAILEYGFDSEPGYKGRPRCNSDNIDPEHCTVIQFAVHGEYAPEFRKIMASLAPDGTQRLELAFQPLFQRRDVSLGARLEQFAAHAQSHPEVIRFGGTDPQVPCEPRFPLVEAEPAGMSANQAVDVSRSLLLIAPSFGAAMQGLKDRRALDNVVSRELTRIISVFGRATRAARDVLGLIENANKDDCAVPDRLKAAALEAAGRVPPEQFRSALIEDEPGRVAAGLGYAYSTAPAELAQRLSTISGAAESVALALALSAAIPQSGVGIDSKLGYLRGAAGRIEAMERTPIVIGFSSRGPALRGTSNLGGARESETLSPQFGWVFGPRIMLDTAKNALLLRHSVANYEVSADVAIPGWWPKVRLKLERAWIGNWWQSEGRVTGGSGQGNAGGVVGNKLEGAIAEVFSDPDNVNTTTFLVPLPHTRADLDGLTNRLARRTIGQAFQQAKISNVEPSRVSVCAGVVTFLVYGPNLWRSTEAYLSGLRHQEIRVLPDMEGVAVTFNIGELPPLPDAAEPARLVVWTRNGSTDYQIDIAQSGAAGQCNAVTALGRPFSVTALNRRIMPGERLQMVVQQGTLPDAYSELRLALRPASSSRPFEWMRLGEASIEVMSDRTVLSQTVAIDPQHPTATLYRDGQEVEAGLLIVLRPGQRAVEARATRSVIYYQTAAAARVVITTSEIKSLEEEVLLRVPIAAEKAFPGFAEKWDIEAQIVGQPGLRLAVEMAPGRERYEYRIKLKPADAKKFADLHEKQDLEVLLKVVGRFEGDPPGVEGKLIVKQKS